MERIICDTYVKGEKHIWSSDKDNPSTQAFNRKILAVNEMYGWLYEKGILRDVAFEIRDYSDVTFFALDVKDLEPYREHMAASGVKDTDVALRHIFDEDYTPCEFSGAIELGWTMMGYRDFDGTVSRSWECGLVKGLNACAALDVQEVKERESVRAAVRKTFEFAGFFPSDIAKDGTLLSVKPLNEEYERDVQALDAVSGNCVADMLDCPGYVWGLFKDRNLVGCCTIGGADVLDDEEGIDYPGFSCDSLLLSDVFVSSEHRGQGCGAFLVDQAIRQRTKNDQQLVFLMIMDDRLSSFYDKIGFSMFNDGMMVRDERPLEVRKFEEAFERAFEYYSSKDLNMENQRDYLFSHAEKLVECYERGESLDLMGVDFWVRFEILLGESLNFVEYQAVNAVLDGDPHDIEDGDVKKIAFLREALQEYRKEGYMWEPGSVLSLIEGAVLRATKPSSGEEKARDMEDLPF